jgi:probable rRNA maturation factor
VALVDETEMKKLNQQYRGKDDSTDVLSFCYENSAGELNGELVLCVAVIKKNAQQDGSAFELEFRKNLAHGFLHILGFEHSDEMFAWQKEMAEIEF